MMAWDRFKDLSEQVNRMYCRLEGKLEEIVAILDDIRGFYKDTAYWYDLEDGEVDDGGHEEGT